LSAVRIARWHALERGVRGKARIDEPPDLSKNPDVMSAALRHPHKRTATILLVKTLTAEVLCRTADSRVRSRPFT